MSFERNQNLEELLTELNGLLKPAEHLEMKARGNNHTIPCILQLGSPRSGSTFLTQWIANLGVYSGPTNFLSRFYGAPYIGALIYEMITNQKYDYRNELSGLNGEVQFESSTGKTSGFNAPHEFWYFWRQHFEFPDVPTDNKTFMESANFESFNKELSLIHQVFKKPFVMKAHNINWYLDCFSKNMSNAVYVHMYREPVANIRSLLKARVLRCGSENEWFSFKPREYELLISMDAYFQVAGQVYFSEKAILEHRKMLSNRYISFTYEELCSQPEIVYKKLAKKVNQFSSVKISESYSGEKSFKASNPKTEFDDKKIEEAFRYFEVNYGKLDYRA